MDSSQAEERALAPPDPPRRCVDIKERWAGDDLILYNPERGRLHVLNRTAAAVWSLCDGAHSVADMSQELNKLFRIDPEAKPGKDVRAILCSFTEENLLSDSRTAPSVPDTGDRESG